MNGAIWDDSPEIDGARRLTVTVGDDTVIVHIDEASLLDLGRHLATDGAEHDGAQHPQQ